MRAEREMHNEIMRRVQNRDQASNGPGMTITENNANHDISGTNAMRNNTTDSPNSGSE